MSAVPLPIGLPTKSGPSVDVTRDLLVRETFGPTWQGEGEHVGHVAAFVRLGGCNQHCWWCDEPQSWVYDERHAAMHRDGITYDPKVVLTRRSPKDVATDALARLPGHGCVVITGGEPMLQQPGVLELLRCIREIGDGFFPCVEIETAGTIPTSTSVLWELVQFNVSPSSSTAATSSSCGTGRKSSGGTRATGRPSSSSRQRNATSMRSLVSKRRSGSTRASSGSWARA